MEIDEKINYWLEISDYDLKTAEAMQKTKRFLYVVTQTKEFQRWIKKKLLKK